MLEQLRLVEIELHSYCNRKCGFCPNSYIDRDFYKEMDEMMFINILVDLIEHDYKGYISFSRYNEPFSKPELLKKRIKQIRSVLPEVTLVSNTNGDYNITGIDIDEITVMDYGNLLKDEHLIDHGNKKVKYAKLKNINNRGGALDIKTAKRTTPCYEPKYFVGIDYTGDVTPCCNIRHDVEKQKDYILGNLKNSSLVDILQNDKAVEFRESVAKGEFPAPCTYCTKTEGRYTRQEGNIND